MDGVGEGRDTELKNVCDATPLMPHRIGALCPALEMESQQIFPVQVSALLFSTGGEQEWERGRRSVGRARKQVRQAVGPPSLAAFLLGVHRNSLQPLAGEGKEWVEDKGKAALWGAANALLLVARCQGWPSGHGQGQCSLVGTRRESDVCTPISQWLVGEPVCAVPPQKMRWYVSRHGWVVSIFGRELTVCISKTMKGPGG